MRLRIAIRTPPVDGESVTLASRSVGTSLSVRVEPRIGLAEAEPVVFTV